MGNFNHEGHEEHEGIAIKVTNIVKIAKKRAFYLKIIIKLKYIAFLLKFHSILRELRGYLPISRKKLRFYYNSISCFS